mgnify:CR=1 FL=1|jgi:hypothetical protein
MLIVSENNKAINLDNISVMYIGVKNIMMKSDIGKHCVMCDLMDGYTEIIKTCKTRTEAVEMLDKILNQYDRGQRVIKL